MPENNDWPQEIFENLATLGRQQPRAAIALAEDLSTWVYTRDQEKIIHEHLEDFRQAEGIYEQGLKQDDIEYLSALEDSRLGEEALFNRLGTTDKRRILEEVEPFLVRLGFVQSTGRGREITPEGLDYLLNYRRNLGQG
jgi:Holliday junction resolvasome RuvABC ATP-dependent DNA helicase subunit